MTRLRDPAFKVAETRSNGSGLPSVLLTAILLLGMISAQTALNIRIEDVNRVTLSKQAENVHRWDPRLFRMLSFGNLPAAVDWIWIEILLDSNVSHVAPGTHPEIYYDFKLLSDLDPINFETYKAGADLLAIIRNDGEGAREILEKGERFRKEKLASLPQRLKQDYWSYSWGIPFLLGYTYLFELNDLPHAAIYFKEASTIPGSPPYLQSLARRLDQPGGEYEVGLKLLNWMIQGEKREDAREGLIKKRNSLYIGQYLADLNRTFQKYLSAVSRSPDESKPDRDALQKRFRSFLKESRTPLRDPWGGRLSLDQQGKIVTTTPHDKVLGLE